MIADSNVNILTGFAVSTSVARCTFTRVGIIRKVFQTGCTVETVVVVTHQFWNTSIWLPDISYPRPQQDLQIQPVSQHTHLLSGGHWNRRYPAHSSGGADPENRETGEGPQSSPVTQRRRCTCFSSCLWHYKEGNAVSFQSTFATS